jgi:hypothetical protein
MDDVISATRGGAGAVYVQILRRHLYSRLLRHAQTLQLRRSPVLRSGRAARLLCTLLRWLAALADAHLRATRPARTS